MKQRVAAGEEGEDVEVDVDVEVEEKDVFGGVLTRKFFVFRTA